MNVLLAIDVGNTNTMFALFDGDHMMCHWRCATEAQRTGDEYFVWLSSLMGTVDSPSIGTVVIASVVPNVLFHLKSMCRQHYRIDPLIVGSSDCRLPVAPKVDENAHVGADRLANATAAFTLYGGDLIVVDFGTATNFDVVDADGAYVGGAIAPGIELSVRVLHQAAAALPHVEIMCPQKAVGTNTRDCLHAGIYWGHLSMVEGICDRICTERGCSMQTVGTGGLASLFDRESKLFDHVNENLTMHGLALISQHNRE